MENLILFVCLYLTLLLTNGISDVNAQQDKCLSGKKDIAFLIEFDADPSSPSHVSSFLTGIARKLIVDRCNRIAVIVVSTQAERIISFNCQSRVCFSRGISQIKKLKSKIASAVPSDFNRDNLLKGIQFLSDGTFTSDRKEFKRVVVAVLSSASKHQKKDFTVENAFKDVQDVSDQIIVVALKRAITYDLRAISLDGDLTSTSRFSGLVDKRRVDTIMNMISSPSGALRGFGPIAASVRDAFQPSLTDIQQTCNQYLVDIGFLVDSSGSLKADYDEEKLFVQRIATRFNISDTGSHAGVIIFSDVGYVVTRIRFTDYTNYVDFNKAVQNLPFYGYRTRIDLALKLANEQLFTLAATSRPNVKKVLFLITDGRQNPTVENGIPLSPVDESIPLHDNDVQIFAIGIGTQINRTELALITRSEERVYSVDNFQELVSDDFVRNVSQELCSAAIKEPSTDSVMIIPTPSCNTTQPLVMPKRCHGNCSSCCGSQNIYINIFDGKSPHYFMQNVQVQQSGSTGLSNGIIFPKTEEKDDHINSNSSSGSPKDNVVSLLKKLLPYQKKLTTTIEELLKKANQKPEMVINRKRKSLAEVNDLMDVLNTSDSKLFARYIKEYGIDRLIKKLNKHGKNVVIFVPRDQDFENELRFNPRLQMDELIQHHIGFIEDELDGIVKCADGKHYLKLYRQLLTSSVQPTGVEDALIHKDHIQSKEGIVYFIDKVLHPPRLSLQKIIARSHELSIFNALLRGVGLWKDIKSPITIKRFCVSATVCYKSKRHEKILAKRAKRLQYTIFAPTNEAMIKYAATLPNPLMEENKEGLASLILPDIILRNSIDDNSMRCEASISRSNIIRCLQMVNNTLVFDYKADQLKHSNILKSYRATNGVLHIIDEFIPMTINI